MAKSKLITPANVRALLSLVVVIGEELAPKTTTTVDDKLIAALKQAQENPVLFNVLLTILLGEDEVTPPASLLSDQTSDAIEQLEKNSELIHALFAIAKAPE